MCIRDRNNGLNLLEEESSALPAAASALDEGTDVLSDGAQNIAQGLDSLSGGVNDLQAGADALSAGFNTITGEGHAQSAQLRACLLYTSFGAELSVPGTRTKCRPAELIVPGLWLLYQPCGQNTLTLL